MPSDFTYTESAGFCCLCPETEAAARLWSEQIAPQTDGTGKIFAPHFSSVRQQLRAAGYTVRKARASKQSDANLLGSLGL